MNLGVIFRSIGKVLNDNSTTILTALGVSGTVTTAYLASKASIKAANEIERVEKQRDRMTPAPPTMDKKEKAQLVWKMYIPTVVVGTVTVTSIIFANKLGLKRTAAAYSLLSVSERAFAEYKEKVVDQLGTKKEKELRADIAKDRLQNSPVVVVGGAGPVLCYEMHTGRYFMASVESLHRAVNAINFKARSENEAYLSDFYYILGLENTSYSHNSGWTADRMLELQMSTHMSQDERPAVCFEYNYLKSPL